MKKSSEQIRSFLLSEPVLSILVTIAAFFTLTSKRMSTDSKTITLSTIAVLTSSYTILQSKKAIKQTEESTKLTKETILKTEAEQQKRDIEKRFDYFYYPLKDYLESRPIILIRNERDIYEIAHYRYLATDKKTREQFETFTKNKHLATEEDKKLLLQHITEDIKPLEDKLRELNNSNQKT